LGSKAPEDRAIRVLLADDHPINCAVVEVILSRIDAQLVTVGNGAEAVEAFKAESYDVVLMDLQMPVMDGLSAIREIRRLEAASGAAVTPILVVSANALADDVAAARDAGAQVHIAKPVTPDVLLHAIEESWLSRER
jgi:CheY-like chemotaxis protein